VPVATTATGCVSEMSLSNTCFLPFAAAFVRGRYLQGDAICASEHQIKASLADLSSGDLQEVYLQGQQFGLRLHKFKRTRGLARVRRVIGSLQGLAPRSLLDIGSGRGAFLWPLLETFPELPVAAVDVCEQRASDLMAVRLGGIDRLTAAQMDVTDLKFNDGSFDTVTLLEVLEHIPQPSRAVSEVVRVARRFVVLSVPSKPDDNPQHIHLFDEQEIRRLFRREGVNRLTFDYVPGHMIVVINVASN
jgi:SAM-dependent methyltransferase